jgi:hypothetical protein
MTQEKIAGYLKMNIKFNHPVTAYALQIGGVLQLAFVSAPIVLVDRNIVGMAKLISNNSQRHDVEANRWWFEFINSSSVLLNPALSAMEGKNNNVPSLNEFREQFNDARLALANGLPNARVMSFTDIHYEATYEIILRLANRYLSEKRFLVKAAPIVANRCKDNELPEIENNILELSSKMGITENPLLILSVLSCLYENKNGEGHLIGKKIIKPKPIYSDMDAHNALSDIRALEMLVAANTIGGPEVALCTHDKNLAKFWWAISVTNPRRNQDTVKFDLTPQQELFPRLNSEEFNRLIAALKEHGL